MNYKIQIEPGGASFTANADESILEAALRQQVGLSYSCRDGLCGVCKAHILEGEVTYPGERPEALTVAEQAEGMALLCQAHAGSDCRIEAHVAEAIAGIPIRKLPCRVITNEQLAHDVIRLDLKLPEGTDFKFLAGQYIDFLLQNGHRRSFSIANAPHDAEHLELHVRHAKGGEFTDFVFEHLKTKALLRMEGPLGSFYLREDTDRPIIFMAGGTGFAPIKGIIEHALHEGINRPMHLYWGARSKRDLYMNALPEKWAEEHAHITYVPVLSDPLKKDNWQGRTGFVHDAIMTDFDDLSGFDIYAGGPPQMVHGGFEAFAKKGLTEEHYFSDSFEYARDSK
ncbi:CDP-6-deoxy-delta-3,4-glucoseen reductase [Sulfuriflexus mobilis]|uniref:CDP-6-deoxy-delta-3,4-glucoseen reductase n=1 Tax=Sulfuriflexus mobilis TaxID=1811807 RepID=UPI000F845C5B|nr:CDP-6-deoxy-delta-3,4-glucoseen reductase [Sulfuriflexus mobilis]